jgi:hypothetical protein
MDSEADPPNQPRVPMCTLAQHMVTANPEKRRSLVKNVLRNHLSEPEQRRWWYQEAKAEIRKFLRRPGTTRQSLLEASNRLRELAARESKESKQATLRASASAVESFAAIADSIRNKKLVPSAGQRDGAYVYFGKVRVSVAPDLLFLDRQSEAVVGGLKIYTSRDNKLNTEALLSAAAILFHYFQEQGEEPRKGACTVLDVFSESFEHAPSGIKRLIHRAEASCEDIEQRWATMYDSVLAELVSKPQRHGQD